MLSNSKTIKDADGDYSDWIELYNHRKKVDDMTGYYISDDPENPKKYKLPECYIDPHGPYLLFASGKDKVVDGEIHLNFKLNSSSKEILLSNPEGKIISRAPIVSCNKNVSYARTKDAWKEWERCYSPSPGESNNYSSGVLFSHPSGFYTWNFGLKMYSKNEDEIRYTTDGSDPTSTSQLCKDSIPISSLIFLPDSLSYIPSSNQKITVGQDNYKANTIKAATFRDGKRTSGIYTRSYFVGREKEKRYPNVPVLSIVTDANNFFHRDSGIYVPGPKGIAKELDANYYQKGKEWERTCNIEYFNEKGEAQFQQDIGIRIQGRIRRMPQKSLRLVARKEYGAPEIRYPLFENKDEDSYKKLVLRNSAGCWTKTMLKDQCTAYICKDLNVDYMDGHPVIVFINGEYWGIHTIREYLDDELIAGAYDINADSVNIVIHGTGKSPRKDDWGTEEGSAESHFDFYKALDSTDMRIPESYSLLEKHLDMSSIIDYYCIELYFNNRDWPGNNNLLWSNGRHGKWRQILIDMDAAWTNPDNDLIGHLLSETVTALAPAHAKYLFKRMMENEIFRKNFLDRMACLLKNELSTETIHAAVDKYKALYTPLVKEHIRRWQLPGSYTQWESKVNQLKGFATERPKHLIQHISTHFGVNFDPSKYSCN